MLIYSTLEETGLPEPIIESLRSINLDTPIKVLNARDSVLRKGKGISVNAMPAIRKSMRTPLGQALIPFVEAGESLHKAMKEFYPDEASIYLGPDNVRITLGHFRKLTEVVQAQEEEDAVEKEEQVEAIEEELTISEDEKEKE